MANIIIKRTVYLASMCVKTEHTNGAQNRNLFQNAYLMVMPAETWATIKVQIEKSYAFIYHNLLVYTKN